MTSWSVLLLRVQLLVLNDASQVSPTVSFETSSIIAIPPCLRLVFRYIAPMTDRTNHHCSSGHAAISLRLRAFAVRVPELQGPACGRFMR